MTSLNLFKKSTLLAAMSATLIAAAASSAVAMPVSGGVGAGTILQRTAEQHRIYPGSENAAAEKARAERNAPNRFCEKQENRCE